jgi:hypothetical protein
MPGKGRFMTVDIPVEVDAEVNAEVNVWEFLEQVGVDVVIEYYMKNKQKDADRLLGALAHSSTEKSIHSALDNLHYQDFEHVKDWVEKESKYHF